MTQEFRWRHVCQDELELLGFETVLGRAGVRTRTIEGAQQLILETEHFEDALRAQALEGRVAACIAARAQAAHKVRLDRRAKWVVRSLIIIAAIVGATLLWQWLRLPS